MKYRLVIIILCCLAPNAFATQWQTLAPGLSYTKIMQDENRSWRKIHAFKIDPNKFQLQLAIAKDGEHKTASVKELAAQHRAIIAINGGFFTAKGEPIGLRVSAGKIRQSIHGTSWWGVFYLQNNKPHIVGQSQYQHHKNIHFAVQSGPRLIVNGKIPKLKQGDDQRTALGITRDKKIIIVATEHYPVSTTELALVMRGLLDCQYALNLDGGNSTQLYASIGDLNVQVHGLSTVSDAVIVLPR